MGLEYGQTDGSVTEYGGGIDGVHWWLGSAWMDGWQGDMPPARSF